MVAHSMELDELLFSSFFMDHGNNNELKETSSNLSATVKIAEIAENMSDVSGKTVLSAGAGRNLWWRLSEGRIRFAWDNNLVALTFYIDNQLIGTIDFKKL